MNDILKLVSTAEEKNRTDLMKDLMASIAEHYADHLLPGKLKIVNEWPSLTCSVAVYLNKDGKAKCAPIDPLAISFYAYNPSAEEEVARRASNPGMRKSLRICGPLRMVDSVRNPDAEISKEQLIAIQTLIGNNSTWWPITDYSDQELQEVFGSLELNVVFWKKCPVGVVHLDYSALAESKAVKIVFIGLDPAVQGQGLGRELLHQVMSDAMDRGAQKIYLDTVAHRDIRTKTSADMPGASSHNPSAHDVYLKAGFKFTGVKLIDPANKQQLEDEGLAVNQLNGPLEYAATDLKPLRLAVYATFHIAPDKTLSVSD